MKLSLSRSPTPPPTRPTSPAVDSHTRRGRILETRSTLPSRTPLVPNVGSFLALGTSKTPRILQHPEDRVISWPPLVLTTKESAGNRSPRPSAAGQRHLAGERATSLTRCHATQVPLYYVHVPLRQCRRKTAEQIFPLALLHAPSSFQFWRSSHSNVFPKEAYVREARQQSSRNNAGVQRERSRPLASLRNSEPATWAHRREGSLGAPIPIRKWQQTLPPVPVREDFGRLLAQTTQVGRSFLHQFSRI